jgi:hypothetical protein
MQASSAPRCSLILTTPRSTHIRPALRTCRPHKLLYTTPLLKRPSPTRTHVSLLKVSNIQAHFCIHTTSMAYMHTTHTRAHAYQCPCAHIHAYIDTRSPDPGTPTAPSTPKHTIIVVVVVRVSLTITHTLSLTHSHRGMHQVLKHA